VEIITAFVIAILFGCAIYLILQKCLIKLLFGFGLLGHAANLFLIFMSKSPANKLAPMVTDLTASYVDPIPQALILTAIVIGFGMTAFLIVFIYRLLLNRQETDMKRIYDHEQ
jgi:multicomponent Na+:H+ antiporter subunit C